MKFKDAELQADIKWTPHPGQKEIIDSTARDVVICAGRRWGKALYIYTPILTEYGFKAMKDINVGDKVFGKDGKISTVIRKTEIMYNRDCYEVVFSDSTSIKADGEHLWEVETRRYRKNKARNGNTENSVDSIGRKKVPTRLEVKTTKELLNDYRITRPDGRTESRYSIKNTSSVEFEEKKLLIEPYTFGCWLGDGTSAGNGFCSADKEILDNIEKDGYSVIKLKGRYAYSIKTKSKRKKLSFSNLLRELGVLNNKHIPEEYLFSSIRQRTELLKGLMDTDGYCEKKGNIEYCGTNKKLCEDVNFILNSLGIKTGFYEYDCKLYGRYIGKKYRIGFTTSKEVFKLKRKSERQNAISKKDTERRFIKQINKIDSVPVMCIEVDNKEKIYLAGKQLVPTHNSAVCAYIALKTILAPGKKVWIVAPSYDLTQKVFEYLVKWLVKAVPVSASGISYRPFPKIKMGNGSVLECKSTENPQGLLGEELDLIIADECSRIPRRVYEGYIYPTTSSRKGRTFFISTPLGKNWFFDKWHEAKTNEDGQSFHFMSKDNPYLPEEEWDRARQRLPEQVFKQEYEAVFLEDAASVFRGIKEIIKDNSLQDAVPGHRYVMGVDLGKHNDFTVLTVIDKWNNNVVYWDRFNKIEYPFQKARIKSTAQRYNNARIVVDSTGVGDPIHEDLSREALLVDDYKFTNKSKKELIEKLSIFIEQKFVWIPPKEELIDELEAFGYQISESMNVIYSAPTGLHDDCVYSLALAVWGLGGKAKPETPLQIELSKNFNTKKPKYD
jgi:hypothetical protein